MKLLLSIVNSDDADGLMDALLSKGYRATKISTTGGFLRQGNATILIGTEDDKVESVLAIIKSTSHTRTEVASPMPAMMGPEPLVPEVIEVVVGGATVFILNVEQFWRF